MDSKIWIGKLHKITETYRGGSPKTEEITARVIVSNTMGAGCDKSICKFQFGKCFIHIQERHEIGGEISWIPIPIHKIHVDSILRALAETA